MREGTEGERKERGVLCIIFPIILSSIVSSVPSALSKATAIAFLVDVYLITPKEASIVVTAIYEGLFMLSHYKNPKRLMALIRIYWVYASGNTPLQRTFCVRSYI